jgi:hypothetical protein
MSKVIHNPALASVDELSAQTSATFVIEPLHAGYGNTLGNSLRRVCFRASVVARSSHFASKVQHTNLRLFLV